MDFKPKTATTKLTKYDKSEPVVDLTEKSGPVVYWTVELNGLQQTLIAHVHAPELKELNDTS